MIFIVVVVAFFNECDAHKYVLADDMCEASVSLRIGLSAIAEFDRYNFRSEPINLCMQKQTKVQCGEVWYRCVVFIHHFVSVFLACRTSSVFFFVSAAKVHVHHNHMRVCVFVCNISDFAALFSFSIILYFLFTSSSAAPPSLLLLVLFIFRLSICLAWVKMRSY